MTAHTDILICSVVAVLIFGTAAAQAEPVHLACYGKIRFTDFSSGNAVEAPTQEGRSISLIIDTSAGTIAVEEYSPVKFMEQLNDVWVFDASPEDSTQVYLFGTLNRTTGEAEINTVSGWDALQHGFAALRRFEGTCKPVKPAF
jgi:hypothetical protein